MQVNQFTKNSSNIILHYSFVALYYCLDIIHGKLDQQNCCLEVEYAIGRDVKASHVGQVIQTLTEWCEACEVILGAVETQVNKANNLKENFMRHKASVDEEIQNIKKTLKTQVD